MVENSVIKGLLVTLNNDEGPKILVNLSDLDEIISMKLAIMGMTVFMFGNEAPDFFANKYYKVIGFVPIPSVHSEPGTHSSSDYYALASIFNVKNDIFTHDQRAMKFGRDAIVWLLFEQSNRKKIFNFIEKIEEITRLYFKDIKYESQIYQKFLFLNYLKEIRQVVDGIDKNMEKDHISVH